MERKLKTAADSLPETQLAFQDIAAKNASVKKPFIKKPLSLAAALAACLVLLISAGLGGYAYAEETREYSAALQFFHANCLSTEGLTRGEIKAVYRDITAESFTYSKTAEVIKNSLSAEQIAGYEIWQDTPSPEEIAKFWKDRDSHVPFVFCEPDTYRFGVDPIWNDEGVWIDEICYVKKYEGDNVVWRTNLPFWTGDYCEVPGGVIVFGRKTPDAWIAKLSEKGAVLWMHQLENGFYREIPEGVLLNGDGSYTLFSSGDNRYLCVSRYTAEGKRTLYKKTDLGAHTVNHIAHYDGGYLLEVSDSGENEFARFVQLDAEGNVCGGFSYKDEESRYVIKDMTEWGGKVYISAYAVPHPEENGTGWSSRSEIGGILDYVFSLAGWDISSEELTPLVRDNYTAVLLVSDPADNGKIEVFYSIPGSLGADLILSDDGRLIWETESIVSTIFSPATNSFTVGGVCSVYQYAFSGEGKLLGYGQTDRLTDYRR